MRYPAGLARYLFIRWHDPRIVAEAPGCDRGWRAIVARDEVIRAVEIDDDIGVALIEC